MNKADYEKRREIGAKVARAITAADGPEVIRQAHATWDEFWAKMAPQRAKNPVTCVKGCHACCAEPLMVSELEAELMVQAIPAPELEGVKQRASEWAVKAYTSGLLAIDPPSAVEWLRSSIMCPLLKDGLCLVYQQRPLGCRSHCATGDPKLCHSPDTRREQTYVTSPELGQGVAMMIASVSPNANHLGVYLAQKLLGWTVTSAAQKTYPLRAVSVTADGCLNIERT